VGTAKWLFREGIVIGGGRPAVRFGDSKIGERERRGFGSHGTAAVGMQHQLAGGQLTFGGGVIE
jgi:hypothetical protein